MRLLPLAIAAGLALSPACRNTSGPPPVIDPAMASYLPPSTIVAAGIDLDRVRASPLSAKLPPAAAVLIEQFHDANALMLASDGRDLLSIARHGQSEPSVAGPANLTAAALAQHKTGNPGAPGLVAYASTIAAGSHIWLAARGGVALPLTGNAANLNRLLRDSDYASITLKLGSALDLSFSALGRTPDAAKQVEETLRAIITLASVGESHQPDLLALLHAIQLTREDRTVKAAVSASPDTVQKLLGSL